MMLCEDHGLAARIDAPGKTFEQRVARISAVNRKVRPFHRQMGTGGETDQVQGERQRVDFIEIVDTPYQASFNIAPGSEVLHMQVANCQDVQALSPRFLPLAPKLHPA